MKPLLSDNLRERCELCSQTVWWSTFFTTTLYVCLSVCLSVCLYVCVGLSVSERSLSALLMRYADRQTHIRFNDFVACFIKLKTMMSK